MSKNNQDIDVQYILGLKNQNEIIFKEVYHVYWDKLYISAYNILRDREQSEDVVQEVFSYLWDHASTIKISDLRAWLYTAVRYQVFNIIRSGKVHARFQQTQIQELETENIAEIKLENEEIRTRLMASIDELPPRCKEIFILSRLEQLSHKEIAVKLGISEKTVENQITIALKKLQVSLRDLLFVLTFLFFN